MTRPRTPFADRAPILLDLDGTLVDTLLDIRASLNHVRAEVGLPAASPDEVRGMIGDGAAVLLERGLADAPRPLTPDDARAVFVDHHRQQCTVHATSYPGVATQLRAWRLADHPLAVVTNKPEALARRVLEAQGLLDLVDAVVGGDSTTARKPSPVPLRHALALLGNPEAPQPVMVGDGIPDVRAGRALGAFTIAVTYGYRSPDSLAVENPDGWWQQFGGPTLDRLPVTVDPRDL